MVATPMNHGSDGRVTKFGSEQNELWQHGSGDGSAAEWFTDPSQNAVSHGKLLSSVATMGTRNGRIFSEQWMPLLKWVGFPPKASTMDDLA